MDVLKNVKIETKNTNLKTPLLYAESNRITCAELSRSIGKGWGRLFLLLFILAWNTANAQVGIGTTTPKDDAALEVESTTRGFLPPRMTEAERDAITSPAQGLVIYNTDTDCVQFHTGETWYNLCDINIVTPSVYSASTGQIWMDRNLGASQVATPSTDSDSYGDLYQWGRAADGHEDRTSTEYTAVQTTDGVANFNASGNAWDGLFILRDSGDDNWVDPSVSEVDNLWQGVNGINNPCPIGYRVPTEAEWQAEIDDGNWSNATDAFSSSLALPRAGIRPRGNGTISIDGSGYYWSSTVSNQVSRRLLISDSNCEVGNAKRAFGMSVRCIQE